MITIIFPDWMGYMFVATMILYLIQNAMQIYLWWLKRKLKKMGGEPESEL